MSTDHVRWQDGALCAQIDADLWFPNKGERGRTQLAKRICGGCGLRAECLQYALDHRELHGVYGGTTPSERRRMLAHPAAA